MSVTTTLRIGPSPVFSTVIVQVTVSPTWAWICEGVLVIRTAPGRISTGWES